MFIPDIRLKHPAQLFHRHRLSSQTLFVKPRDRGMHAGPENQSGTFESPGQFINALEPVFEAALQVEITTRSAAIPSKISPEPIPIASDSKGAPRDPLRG
jgi:hypothetical protein